MRSDQNIIDLVNKGKADAFSELVARYQMPVYRLAGNILANHTDAEDVAQEVFLRAYKNLDSYTEQGQFWGWLRRITVNICIRQIQTVKPVYLEDMDNIIDDDNSEVCDSIIRSEELQNLRKLIRRLPLMYRSVIVLRYLEEMSYSEIAEILGESVSNVQVRVFRAKKMLRESMQVGQR